MPRMSSPPGGSLGARPALDRLDAGTALLLAVAFAGLYVLAFQDLLSGDGVYFAGSAAKGDDRLHVHALYLPVARAAAWLYAADDPFRSLRGLEAASWIPGGCAVGATYLLCRSFGAGRAAALLASLLAAGSPAMAFNATRAEVHALCGFVTALAGVWLLRRRWTSVGLAMLGGLAVIAAFIAAHMTSLLLGLGVLYLAAWSAARAGLRVTAARVHLVHGPLLLAGSLAMSWAADRVVKLQHPEWDTTMFEFSIGQIGLEHWPAAVFEGWIGALGLVWLPALAWYGSAGDGWGQAAVAALVVPPALCLGVLWALPEHGGYAVGVLPFAAAAAARGLDRLRGLRLAGVGLALVLLQAAWTRWSWPGAAEVDGLDLRARVRAVEEAGSADAVVFSAFVGGWGMPPIEAYAPRAREVALDALLHESAALRLAPEEFARRALAELAGEVGAGLGLVDLVSIELARRLIDRLGPALTEERRASQAQLDALLAELEGRWGARRVGAGWDLLAFRVPAAELDALGAQGAR
jgi:hypothetical protein